MTAYDDNNKANVICCWASIKNHNKELISEKESDMDRFEISIRPFFTHQAVPFSHRFFLNLDRFSESHRF